MAYAGVDDLLLGDVRLSSRINPLRFINDAAEEIDARVGLIYRLPLVGLEPHAQSMLKRINAHLATGRLLLAIDGGNDDNLHAYGRDLINGALADLAMIANGLIALAGAEKLSGVLGNTSPAVINQDAYSATAAFEAFISGHDATWSPGA